MDPKVVHDDNHFTVIVSSKEKKSLYIAKKDGSKAAIYLDDMSQGRFLIRIPKDLDPVITVTRTAGGTMCVVLALTGLDAGQKKPQGGDETRIG